MNTKRSLITLSICLISFLAGVYFGPKKTETVEVEKIVYKDRIIDDKKRDVYTRTKEIHMPDGTYIREISYDVKEEKRRDTTREVERERSKTVTVENRPDWRIGAFYKPAILYFQREEYGVIFERRIIGEIYVGIMGSSNQSLGITVSVGL